MIFPDFDPVMLHLGPLAIRWYALAYVAGILLGWRYAVGLVRNARLWGPVSPPATPAQIDDLVLWVTLGVIIGGRLGYELFYDTSVIWNDPVQILKVWQGGMSFHGGLIGVILAIVGFSVVNRIRPLRVGDLIAPAVPIGLFFGRIANFINGELWGRPTHVPWGMVFCNKTIEASYGGDCPAGLVRRHPSQLYEAALEGLVMFAVLRLATHRFKALQREGATTGLFLVGYALCRIALENVRQPDAQMPDFPLGLTMGMMLSAPMLIVGAVLLVRAWRLPAPIAADAAQADLSEPGEG
ncbi:MAG TPA: prolipoprotein diacylglyceryl transferase [Caulobacteraceae bacterium]|nr:prolipoprotein diacylglyceryl transferase [Caulobacteraceae bacterium]